MQVTINIPDELAAQARARGTTVELYVEEMLTRQAAASPDESALESVRAAVEGILEFRKNHTLGGIKIKDLIHEGHKY